MKKDWMIKESELDDDQLKVFKATLDKSCIVSGCAGSGKSVLALIKAQRLQKERGNSYQIIVFTKALCGYMNSGREELGLINEFMYYEEWRWKKYLKHYRNGKSFWVYERDDSGNKIPNMPKSDYVIVDEIQDFEQQEIMEFVQATKKNFFFFGDTAQSIYGGLKRTMPVQNIGHMLYQMGIESKDWELYRNYRLPLPVAKYIQYVGVDLPPFDESIYKSPEKTVPYVLRYPDTDSQIAAIKKLKEDHDFTDIAILVPSGELVKQIGEALISLGLNVEMKYDDKDDFRNSKNNLNFATTNPKVMTYHSAKGLQFEAIFLPYIDSFVDDRGDDSKALYVAMSRTYRYLYIMYSGQLPKPLSKIPANLYKTTETEEVEDI